MILWISHLLRIGTHKEELADIYNNFEAFQKKAGFDFSSLQIIRRWFDLLSKGKLSNALKIPAIQRFGNSGFQSLNSRVWNTDPFRSRIAQFQAKFWDPLKKREII